MTITRDNLEGVSAAVRCVVRNADAFKMISFQPIAQVGRTGDGLGGGVGVEELWRQAARGLDGPAADVAHLLRGQMWLGHPDCNRYVHGFVLADDGARTRLPSSLARGRGARREGDRRLPGALRRGVLPPRPPARRAPGSLAMLLRAPHFWCGPVLPYFWGQLRRMAPGGPLGLRLAWRAGRAWPLQHREPPLHEPGGDPDPPRPGAPGRVRVPAPGGRAVRLDVRGQRPGRARPLLRGHPGRPQRASRRPPSRQPSAAARLAR